MIRASLITALLFATPAFAKDSTGLPRIIDGDTIEIFHERIRLFGIDASESGHAAVSRLRWSRPVGAG